MNSRQRRNRRRLEARSKEQIIARESSPPHKVHKDLRPPRRWGTLFLDRTLSGTKLVWSLAVVVLTLAGGYAIFRPHISVEPYVPLNPVDPYRTQFTVRNENGIFEVHDIQSVCWPRSMESGNGFSVIGPGPLTNIKHAIFSLEPGGSSTVDCPPVIGGLGSYAGEVLNAELEIDVSFAQSWWPLPKTERYAFRAMRDVNKAIHWVHITIAEEKSMLPK